MELIFDVSKKKILDALHVLQDSVKSLVHWFSTSSGTMDFHTSVICVIVFIISALVVYLISVFGMRERTYEEAIEEQRQRNKEAIQQAKSDKTKKEKKFKKWGKKGREKVDDDKPIIAAESEEKVGHEVDSAIGGEVNVTNLDQKNKCFISRRKIKLTALVSNNKENAIFQIPSSSEENDEQHSTSRSSSSSPQKDELVAADLPKILKGKINYAGGKFGKQLIDGEDVSNTFSDAYVANECEESCVSINTSQQMEDKSCSALSETHIEFNRKLISALKVACLSADDLYELTSFLMCKELPLCPMSLDVPSKKTMGSNGSITAEDKVKDLCQKLSQERSNSAATEAFFRDKLSQQRQELQSLQEKIRRSHEQQLSGSSTVKTKIQQLRTKLTEDHAVIVQKLQEEKNQLQQAYDILEKQKCNSLEISRLQQEVEQSRVSTEEYETQLASMQQIQDDLHRQIQQMESHIEQLVNSKQDEEFSLKQRISELNSKLQQSEKSQGPLVQELKNLKTVCGTLESDNASARKRFEEAKKQIGNMEQDVHKLQSKLEESHQQQRELTNCLEQMQNEVIDLKNIQNDHLQQIEDLKQENQSISSQLVGAEKIISTEASDIHHMPKKKEIDLEEHLKMMQEKDAFLLHYSEELSKSEANLLVVSEEVEYLKLQNQEIQEKNRKISTTLSVAEKKLHDIMDKLEDKEKEIVIILSKKTKEIEQALYEKHIKEIDSKNDELKILQIESRNKAVASEKRVEELEKLFYQRVNDVEIEAEHRVHEMLKRSEHILSLLKRDREVLKKMFPDINISSSLDHETWILQFEEKAINNITYLKENSLSTSWLGDKDNLLKQLTEALEEKSKFELRAKHYKSALVDTGNVLSKLQSTAEMEEKIFKQKLLTLEMELKKVLSEYKKLSNDKKNLSDNDVEEIYSQRKLKIELGKLQSELKLKEDQNLEAKKKINELKIEMNKLQSKHTGDEYKKQVFPPTMFVDHSSIDAGISVTSGQATMNVPGTYPAKSEKRKKTKKKGSSGKK